MRVFVVGHRGMLGHVVARYFSEIGAEVITTEALYSGSSDDPLIKSVQNSGADWIINAAAKTGANSRDRAELFLVNFQLPVHLKSSLRPPQRMIHASTDGVFSGRTGNYSHHDYRDASDDYGLSKTLSEVVAEPGRCVVFRCSIIGPEADQAKALLSWFLSQNGDVNGYTNHFWNGITTLEWAKLCAEVTTGKFLSEGIIQPGTANISKYQLLSAIAQVWQRPNRICPVQAPSQINRTLLPTLRLPPIEQQLQELRAWYYRAKV